SWDFVGGAFEVTLSYTVRTPEAEFEAVLTLRGGSAPNKEYEGRQWHVDFRPGKTGDSPEEGGPRMTALGRARMRVVALASGVQTQWMGSLEAGEANRAFLLTLPADQRARFGVLGLAGGAPALVGGDPELHSRHLRFLSGEFLAADPAGFGS